MKKEDLVHSIDGAIEYLDGMGRAVHLRYGMMKMVNITEMMGHLILMNVLI